MKLNFARKVNKGYARMFAGIAICIAGTLLVSSAILYFNFETIAEKQLYSSDLSSLQQASREVAIMTETAKSLTTQIFIDPSFIPLLYSKNPDISEISAATRKLGFYRLSMPFIHSIYIYNAKQNEMFIAAGDYQHGRQALHELDDQGIIKLLADFKNYAPYTPIPRTYEVGILNPVQLHSYTYLGYNQLVNHLENAVVVNFSSSWMNQHLRDEHADFTIDSFIINSEGMLLSDRETEPMLTDLSNQPYIQKILSHSEQPGYFIEKINGIKYLVSYTEPDALGWRYVRVTPTELLTAGMRSIRTNVILVSLVILAAGLLSAGFMSQRLYIPHARAVHRLGIMENERRRHLLIVRHDLLRNVILGRSNYGPEKLQEKLREVGCGLVMEQAGQLIMLRIDHYRSFITQYGDDAKLIKYAIMNIGAEVIGQSYSCETIDMGENHLLLLFNIGEELPDAERFTELLQELQAAVSKHLRLTVSIVVSPLADTLADIPVLYKQVAEASFHCLFRGQQSIIDANEIMQLKAKEYEYPVQKEKLLIDAIMTGKTEEAKAIFTDIIEESAEFPFTVFQLALSHLTMSISNCVNLIQRNNGFVIESAVDTAVISLHSTESIDEITEMFYNLLDEINRVLRDKRNARHDELITRIHEIIELNYPDYNLGLSAIADKLEMSPVYISRLYKQLTLTSLTDVITAVRTKKAKEMLVTTDLSIAEIAEKTGFTNTSYFYRIFKRENGVTPNEFRRAQQPSQAAFE